MWLAAHVSDFGKLHLTKCRAEKRKLCCLYSAMHSGNTLEGKNFLAVKTALLCCIQVKAGIVMNTVCLLVLQLSVNTWAHAYFNLGEFPTWAGDRDQPFNATTNSTPFPSQ